MAAGFHAAVARVIGDVAERERARTGIDMVALSGGVFQNTLLLGLARRELEARHFHVLTHRVVPPNDGGLALGQAAVAGYRARRDGGGSVTDVDTTGAIADAAGPAEDLAPPRWPWPAASPPGPPCGAWHRSGPPTPATSRSSSSTRSSWASVHCRRSASAVPEAAESVRLLARPGDVLLAVSTADDPVVADLLTRADAWGLTSVWLGAGPRPGRADGDARADHVVWLEGVDPAVAARSGDLVLLYHLLWELTHVVFEHPGLLIPEADCADDVCVTCSDEGRVAEVRAVLAEGRVEVLAGGHAEQIDGRLVDGLRPGDLVLVHAGVAVTSLAVVHAS